MKQLRVSLALVSLWVSLTWGVPPGPRPNFLVLLADDLGIGDLGCYGNHTLRTPNIDRLAQEGVRLTHHLAAASVCTPSRAALLTGRYPIRSGMVSSRGHRVLQWAAASGGLPPSEVTFAKVLQDTGYVTGLVGKWHLGLSCAERDDLCHHPLRHGFGHFLGLPLGMMADCVPGHRLSEKVARLRASLSSATLLCLLGALTLAAGRLVGLVQPRWALVGAPAVLGMLLAGAWALLGPLVTRADCLLLHGHELQQQPFDLGTVTRVLLDDANAFLRRHRDDPFLLMVSFLHVHTPLVTTPGFLGTSAHGLYGDNVQELDWMVGEVLGTLGSLGLETRTLVYLASDNGGSLEAQADGVQYGGWNGPYRGGKGMGGWEGGIRVPAIFRWTGVLPAGQVLQEPTSMMDVFPTLVQLAGVTMPSDRVLDGQSLWPRLLGSKADHPRERLLLHFCETWLHAATWIEGAHGSPVWKVHFVTPDFQPPGSGACHGLAVCPCKGPGVTRRRPPLLFDLSRDPSEKRPLGLGAGPIYTRALRAVSMRVSRQLRTLRGLGPWQLDGPRNRWDPRLQPCCGKRIFSLFGAL